MTLMPVSKRSASRISSNPIRATYLCKTMRRHGQNASTAIGTARRRVEILGRTQVRVPICETLAVLPAWPRPARTRDYDQKSNDITRRQTWQVQ